MYVPGVSKRWYPLYSNIEGLSEYGVKTFLVGPSSTILLAQTAAQNLIPILRKANFRKNLRLSEMWCFMEIICQYKFCKVLSGAFHLSGSMFNS